MFENFPQRDVKKALELRLKSGVMWPESTYPLTTLEPRILAKPAGVPLPNNQAINLQLQIIYPGQSSVLGSMGNTEINNPQSLFSSMNNLFGKTTCLHRGEKVK